MSLWSFKKPLSSTRLETKLLFLQGVCFYNYVDFNRAYLFSEFRRPTELTGKTNQLDY
jgi:hypothetical protein